MTKLELQTKVLLAETAGAATEPEKENAINISIRSFACDVLNMIEGLREMKVENTVIKSMVEEYGICYNGKSKKFS